MFLLSNTTFRCLWAGGGGSTADLRVDTDAKVEEAIQRAQWDFSAYQYATMVQPFIFADDATVVGIANDWLSPLVYLGATGVFLYDNWENVANGIAYMTDEMAAIKARVDAQIENLAKKNRPRQGNVYELRAPYDGYYLNVRTGKKDFYMKAGEVWKYGESHDPLNRYKKGSYEDSLNMAYPQT